MNDMDRTYEIECCENDEWLACYGEEEDNERTEPSAEARERIRREYEALMEIPEIALVSPGPGRSTYHGWNGAHFRWRQGQFGTFETLPEPLIDKIERTLEYYRGKSDENFMART